MKYKCRCRRNAEKMRLRFFRKGRLFRVGDLCGQKGFDLDLSDDAIAMSSWIPVGARRWWLYLWCACRSNHVHRLFFRKKNTWR